MPNLVYDTRNFMSHYLIVPSMYDMFPHQCPDSTGYSGNNFKTSNSLYFCKYGDPRLQPFNIRDGSDGLTNLPISRWIAGEVLNIGSKTSKLALPTVLTSKPMIVKEWP